MLSRTITGESAALALAGSIFSARQKRPERRQPPGAARLAGDIGAIPCETQVGSSRAFLPGQSRASFRNPGFGLEGMLCAAPNGVPVWQRAALRQVWQVWQVRRFV